MFGDRAKCPGLMGDKEMHCLYVAGTIFWGGE